MTDDERALDAAHLQIEVLQALLTHYSNAAAHHRPPDPVVVSMVAAGRNIRAARRLAQGADIKSGLARRIEAQWPADKTDAIELHQALDQHGTAPQMEWTKPLALMLARQVLRVPPDAMGWSLREATIWPHPSDRSYRGVQLIREQPNREPQVAMLWAWLPEPFHLPTCRNVNVRMAGEMPPWPANLMQILAMLSP